MNNILRITLLLCVALHFQQALAGEKNAPGKKWEERRSERNIDAGRDRSNTPGLPRWLNDEERKEWKNGRPPGWNKGRKTGWDGGGRPPGWNKGRKTGWDDRDRPPGQVGKKGARPDYAPGSWHRWTEQERRRHEERIRHAERRIRDSIEKKNLPGQILDSATLSLFSAARQGVPVETVGAVIEQGIERGLSPAGIESVTRALSYGVERQADFGQLERIIRNGMNRGLTDDELAMEVYRALSR